VKFLPVDKTQIPVKMLVVVEGEQYEFTFNYNSLYDFFTVSLSKNGKQIIEGEKININKPLFTTTTNPFKETFFIPMDLSNKETSVSYENFGDMVFLWVVVIREGLVVDE